FHEVTAVFVVQHLCPSGNVHFQNLPAQHFLNILVVNLPAANYHASDQHTELVAHNEYCIPVIDIDPLSTIPAVELSSQVRAVGSERGEPAQRGLVSHLYQLRLEWQPLRELVCLTQEQGQTPTAIAVGVANLLPAVLERFDTAAHPHCLASP